MKDLSGFQAQVLRAIVALLKRKRLEAGDFLTYGSVAKEFGKPSAGRAVGAALDPIMFWCRDQKLPDITTIIVTASALAKNDTIPPKALKHYGSGQKVRELQIRVRNFDWTEAPLP